jgi:sucrose-6F-phosphate phosphohydrolase
MKGSDPRPRHGIRLFSTDLDGTVLGHPEAARRFAEEWDALEVRQRPLLAYNTGRTVADTQALVAHRQIPAPDIIIGSVGTELHDATRDHGTAFRARFEAGWDSRLVDEIVSATPGIRRQPAERSHPFKSSWFLHRAHRRDLDDLERRLGHAGIVASVIYSCRYFLDVVPRAAGKGPALTWLCTRLGIELDEVLVAGDTGNDTSMFVLPGVRGIMVENALPELLTASLGPRIFVAAAPMADGVLEGLRHFGVLAATEPGPRNRSPDSIVRQRDLAPHGDRS